jgi:LacI family transcriptional regulator
MLLAGIKPDPALITAAGFNRSSGRQAVERLLTGEAGRRPTAVIAGCDPIALGAVDAIQALGLSVPGDISVVGFDDLPQAARHTPALTTVRQPLHDMGGAATRALLTLIAGQQLPTDDIRLPATFVRRASAAAPRQE